MTPGIFYIVATPIGNLSDITLRAIDILRSVDLILCEDTRVTKKLLDHFEIKTLTLSYHQHSKLRKAETILQLLKNGKNLALVSDAGTPGISDPGNKLINYLAGQLTGLKIVPVPGVSAVTTAASISGLPMDRFVFMGFPPHKRKRKKFFEEVISSKYPVIFYESPYRIIKSLEELKLITKNHKTLPAGRQVNTKVIVCRELTKKFETIYRGEIGEVIKLVEKDKILGEFVVIAGKK